MIKPKLKTCPICGNEFLPYKSTDKCCSASCLWQYNKQNELKHSCPGLKVRNGKIINTPVIIPEQVTREWFESLPSFKQKKVAKIFYERLRAKILAPLMKARAKDITGNYIIDLHHCWFKSQCTLWYYFQEENLLPVSRSGHRAIHDKPADKMTVHETVLFAEAIARKDICIEDNNKYLTS